MGKRRKKTWPSEVGVFGAGGDLRKMRMKLREGELNKEGIVEELTAMAVPRGMCQRTVKSCGSGEDEEAGRHDEEPL